MSNYKVRKVSSLPSPLEADTVYYVKGVSETVFQIYVTNSTGTIVATPLGAVTGAATAGQVAFWNGTSSITGDSGLIWDNTLKSLSLGGFYLAPIHVGNRNVSNSSRAQILISREILSSSGNDHAFSDSSLYSPATNGLAYNSFDARINIGGTANLSHYAAFQDGTVSNNTGTMTNYWGHVSSVTINSGSVANFQHVDINNVAGAGLITNQFGIRVRELTKGTNNWAIYTDGETRSYFGGRVAIGVSNNPDKLLEIRTANGTESGLRIRQLSQNFWDIFSPASSTSLSIGDVGGVRWSFLTGGIFESNGTQTIRSSTGNLTIATGGANGNIIASPNGVGRVGVNTTTIYAKFQTNANTAGLIPALGTTNDSASLAISTQSNSFGLLAGVLSTGNVWMQAQRFTGAADAFNLILQPSGGNVLIGTTTDAGQRLQVSGNTLITGTLEVDTVNNGAGDFLTRTAGGIITRRTAAEVRSDIGAQAAGNYVTTDTNQTVTGIKTFSNGIVDNVTNIGQTASIFEAIADLGWDLPIGTSIFAQPTSVGGPGTIGYWLTTGRRDINGGFSGIYTPYDTSTNKKAYFGVNLTNTSNPTWYEIWHSGTFTPSDYALTTSSITAVSLTTTTLTLTRSAGNLTASVPTWNQDTTGSSRSILGTTVTDLNAVDTSAIFFRYNRYGTGATGTPLSLNNANGLITFSTHSDNQFAHQLAFPDNNTNIYIRRKASGTWGSWRQLFHDDYHPNADVLTTARTLTIGSTGKTFDGSANVSWTLGEIGAASRTSNGAYNESGSYIAHSGTGGTTYFNLYNSVYAYYTSSYKLNNIHQWTIRGEITFASSFPTFVFTTGTNQTNSVNFSGVSGSSYRYEIDVITVIRDNVTLKVTMTVKLFSDTAVWQRVTTFDRTVTNMATTQLDAMVQCQFSASNASNFINTHQLIVIESNSLISDNYLNG